MVMSWACSWTKEFPILNYLCQTSDIAAVSTILNITSYDAVFEPSFEPFTFLTTPESWVFCNNNNICFLLFTLEIKQWLIRCASITFLDFRHIYMSYFFFIKFSFYLNVSLLKIFNYDNPEILCISQISYFSAF